MSQILSKPVQFSAYQGWKNFPTWCVYNQISKEDSDIRQHYQSMARSFAVRTFQSDMVSALESFLKGWCSPDSLEGRIVTDWLFCGVGMIEWDQVYSLLRGNEITEVPHDLTLASVILIGQVPWQNIIDWMQIDCKENNRLQTWTYIQINMWRNNVTSRVHSALSDFARKIYETVLQVVDWDSIVLYLKW